MEWPRLSGSPAGGRRLGFFLLVLLPLSVSSSRIADAGQQSPPTDVVERFKAGAFSQRLEIAKSLIAAHDTRNLARIESLLADPDRHLRGDTAFVFASLGDSRGLDVILAILSDRVDRPKGQGVGCVIRGDGDSCWSVKRQIVADRYYAVHLLGLLRNPRAVPTLVSYIEDPDIDYKIPWALTNIGGKEAINGLIVALRSRNPEVRVYAVEGLEDLHATDAVPEITPLLDDQGVSRYGRSGYVAGGITVGEAAHDAIAALQRQSDPAR